MGSCRVLLLRGGATRTSTPSSSPATTPSTRQPGGRPSELALSTWPTRCSTRAEEAPEEAAREQTPGSWLIIRETPIEINNQHLSPSFLATTTPLSLEIRPRILGSSLIKTQLKLTLFKTRFFLNNNPVGNDLLIADGVVLGDSSKDCCNNSNNNDEK